MSLLFNKSLGKGLGVLLAFSPQAETMNLGEIASYPRGPAYRGLTA